MKKCFKLIGILLSIASLSACQTEDKIIKLDEKGAIVELKKIQKKIGQNLPEKFTIFYSTSGSIYYYGDFSSQVGLISETYSEEIKLTFDLKERYFSQKVVATEKRVDSESKEERLTLFQNYAFYRYFKDNQKYEVTNSYAFTKNENNEPVEEEMKFYTVKDVAKKEFDAELIDSYLAYLYVDQETNADEFFTHTEESTFLNYAHAKNKDVPKTYELRHFGKDKEVLYYYSSEERTLQLEDINGSSLDYNDKIKLHHIEYSAYLDFKLHNCYFTTLANACTSTYKDADNATYELEEYNYRVGAYDTAKIDEVDLTGYKKK